MSGSVRIATSNSYFFTNASNNDMVIFTSCNVAQRILLGTSNTIPAAIAINSNSIFVSGDVSFGGILRQNGVPYVGSQWSNNSSNVFLLGSNVGIGKQDPQTALDIQGELTISSNLNIGGGVAMQGVFISKNNGGVVNVTNNSVPGFSNDNLGVTMNITSNTSNNYWRFVANNTEVFRIRGDGTLLPGTNLTNDIGSSNLRFRDIYVSGNTIDMAGTKIQATSNGGIQVRDSNNSNALLIVSQVQIGTGSNAVKLSLDSSNSLQFTSLTLSNGVAVSSNSSSVGGAGWSNNGSTVFVTGSNIGIGATTANAPLQFANTLVNRKIVLFESVNNDHQYYGLGVNNSILRYQTDLTTSCHAFYAATSATASTELMRIQGNGNVGIGTSTTNAPLQFANAAVNRKIVLYDSFNNDHQYYGFGVNGGMLRYQTDLAASCHAFYAGTSSTSSSELMRIQGNGNVGIGTAAPASALHIASNAAANVAITLCNTATGGRPPQVGLSNSGELFVGTASNHGLVFLTSNVERMRVSSNGFVGIGTVAPTSRLHVFGNTFLEGSSKIVVQNSIDGGSGQGIFMWAPTNKDWGIYMATSGANKSLNDGIAVAGNNFSSYGLRVRVANDVNSGIIFENHSEGLIASFRGDVGGSYIASSLDVAGNVRANTTINLGSVPSAQGFFLQWNRNLGDGATWYMNQKGGGTGGHIWGEVTTANAFTEYMRLSGTGNLGVGTNSPSSKLHVVGAGATANTMFTGLLIQNTGAGGSATASGAAVDFRGYNAASSVCARISAHDGTAGSWGGTLRFFTKTANGTDTDSLSEAMRIIQTGNIGIGTTAPTSKLHVEGNTFLNGANKIVVQNAIDGGSGQGIFMWSATDTNWGIYMAKSGANKSLAGAADKIAVAAYGITSHAIRIRVFNDPTNGIIFENSSEGLIASFNANGTGAYIAGSIKTGNDTWHTSYDGKNRLYYANNDTTYIGSPTGWRFQNATNGDVVTISSTGGGTFKQLSIVNGTNDTTQIFSISSAIPYSHILDVTSAGVFTYQVYDQLIQFNGAYMKIQGGNSSQYVLELGTNTNAAIINAKNTNGTAHTLYLNTNGGAVSVGGTLSKGGGSFDIAHPDPTKEKQGYRLRHCFVESPTRGDNIYTFKVTTTTNNEKFVIDLPDYFKHLNENPRTTISCEEEDILSRCCAKVTDDLAQVKGMTEYPATYTITVIGTRKDQMMVEYFDNTGGVEYQIQKEDPRHPEYNGSS